MIAAAKRNRRLLMEAFMYRLHPQTLRIQKLIEKGALARSARFELVSGSPE